jgi:ribosome-associated toxin RatA of RatAB toxin-antitoxin module
MIRVTLIVLGALAAVVLTVVIVGWMLPVNHRASRRVSVHANSHDVFALVERVDTYPQWQTGVQRVEVMPSNGSNTPLKFRVDGSNGPILFELSEREPDERIVTRIADTTLPFGGKWTYEIAPSDGGASLRITEDGEVYNPVYRFASRFVFGYTRTIDQYLRDVSSKLGGDGRITD